MKAPKFPKDAPFSDDQKSWLSGFLAGIKAVQTSTGHVADSTEKDPSKLLNVLYGTQTGNAESLACETADAARNFGIEAKVQGLDEIDISTFANMNNVIFTIATYGEGEMPDNAELFWKDLSNSDMPKLPNMKFGVLALGDTGYDEFCQAGKLIDMRLEQLGATRIIKRQDCDVDYEEVASSWISNIMPKLSDNPKKTSFQREVKSEKSVWNRKNPFTAVLSTNRLLSKVGSSKEIRHFEVDLSDSGILYEAGDVINILPINSPELVESIITRLGVESSFVPKGKSESIEALLTSNYEISTPSKNLVAYIGDKIDHKELKSALQSVNKEVLSEYLWGKDILDLLNIDPNYTFDINDFLSNLKSLQHRAYSISSSPMKYPNSIHMTISAVRWNKNDRTHLGVCSSYLSDRVPESKSVKIFVSPNKSFRIPEDSKTPMIMVGPGTGVAPFRAFLDEREISKATGDNWLFFGDQTREFDFSYEEEFLKKMDSSLLTKLDLAFSRDQKEKVYVQDRMREKSKEMFEWLERGAHFYVCGDATRMAKDVDSALREIIAQEGKMTPENADIYVNNLKREKRYLRDVY